MLLAMNPISRKIRLLLVPTIVLLVCRSAPAIAQSALDGFDPNANGPIRAVVVQADGKGISEGESQKGSVCESRQLDSTVIESAPSQKVRRKKSELRRGVGECPRQARSKWRPAKIPSLGDANPRTRAAQTSSFAFRTFEATVSRYEQRRP